MPQRRRVSGRDAVRALERAEAREAVAVYIESLVDDGEPVPVPVPVPVEVNPTIATSVVVSPHAA